MASKISAEWPERSAQVLQLARYAGEGAGSLEPAPLAFVSGPSMSGKSTVVRVVLDACRKPAVFVDCRECCAQADVFSAILWGLCRLSGAPLAGSGKTGTMAECLEGELVNRHFFVIYRRLFNLTVYV